MRVREYGLFVLCNQDGESPQSQIRGVGVRPGERLFQQKPESGIAKSGCICKYVYVNVYY